MKLIGSKMESDFREELIRSNEALQARDSKLRMALESEGHDSTNSHVLHWVPEQLEDIYVVLVGGTYVIDVEIDKYDGSKSPTVQRHELKPYLHGLSKMNQVRLAVAQDLACSKI
ncbi:hypothetical protein L1D32_05645 [Shewanella insulae]|uniref:hypothetical protein n=1 Tax=Shewanella insulae TaxID=2681496 RepID=UPI001EFC9124|nr:hypothetical protein [Shewanella insulae]MCG9737634.1 hypothetical protein [Shewanella insulae]